MVDLLLGTREELEKSGFDAGPLSVTAKLRRQGFQPPSRATVARIFTRSGVVVPEPKKKPRSAYIRFTYPQPNACWQIDATEWVLADGSKVAIFQLIDDHSRLAVASLAASGENSEAAIKVVMTQSPDMGYPNVPLGQRGGVESYPARQARSAGGILEVQGCGTHHRETLQAHHSGQERTLPPNPAPIPETTADATTLEVLQTQIDTFDRYYNTEREHQALAPGMTPQEAWNATPKAPAPAPPEPAHQPVRSGSRSNESRTQR